MSLALSAVTDSPPTLDPLASPQVTRILLLTDAENDLIEVRDTLRRGGFAATPAHADSLATLQTTLAQADWDLILAALPLAKFDSPTLVGHVRHLHPEPPLILLLDDLDESTALELIQAGATDYILKHDLARLLPALTRAQRDTAIQRGFKTQLSQAREKYQTIIENAVKGIYQTSPQGRFISANPALARMLGYASPESLIAAFSDVGHQLYVDPRRRAEFQHLLEQDGQVNAFEAEVYHKAGRRLWIALSTRAVRDENGHLLYYEGIAEDITARKRIEDALRDSEEQYRQLFENNPHPMWVYDVATLQFLAVNSVAIAQYGYSREEFLALTIKDIRPATEVPQLLATIPKVEGGRYTGEWMHHKKDGTLFQVSVTSHDTNFNGRAARMVLVSDITESKKAEAALRQSEQSYAELVNSLDGIIWRADAQTFVFNFVSQQAERILGYPTSRWTAESDFWPSHIHPDDRTWAVNFCVAATAEGRPHEFEYRMLAADGRVVWFHDMVKVIIADGHPAQLHGLMVDITARKEVEAQVRQLSRAVEQSPVSIVITDTRGHIEYINKKFTEITGYSATEAIGQHTRILKSGETTSETYTSMWQTIKTGGDWRGELRNKKKNGDLFWEQASISPITDGNGKTTHFIAIKEDISERKERDRELETVALVSAALRGAQTRDEMFPIILDQLLSLLKAEGTSLSLADPLTGDVTIMLGRGNGRPFTGKHLPRGQGVTGHVIETGQPYLSQDAHHDPRFMWPHLLGEVVAVACVPLIAQERVIGALWVGRASEITPEELRLLLLVSNITANAIYRTTLYEQTERQLQNLAALRSIDVAITSNLDLEATLTVLLQEVTAKLAVDAASVLLLNPETRLLEYTAGRGFRSRVVERTRLHLGEGYAGRAALERQRLGIDNLMQNNDFARMALLTVESFEAYYCAPLIAKGEVKGVMEIFHRSPLRPLPEWLEFFETLAGQAVIAIDNALLFQDLQNKNLELTMAYDATIEGWSRALDLRDHETQGHTKRVTDATLRLARAMGLTEAELIHIYRGSLLHDIGKMGIPDNILLKPGLLTNEEQAVMRRHPVYAYEMIAPIAYLRPAIDIPYCHHEKWDGTGYPRGLQAEDIPLSARIFAIIDVWDALRSDRPYRKGWPAEQVHKHILSLSGSHFDPRVVKTFIEVIREDE